MNVSIIGSGLSGLTCAALLAKKGHEVTVFEQYEEIGGVTAGIKKYGYAWDLGPMIVPDLGPDEPGGKILTMLDIFDKVKTRKLYREFRFPDFRISRGSECKGPLWLKDRLTELFPQDAKGLKSYFRYHEKVLDINSLRSKSDLFSIVKLIFKFFCLGKKRSWSAQDLIDHYFSDEKLKAFFTCILADYVCSPSDFPGIAIPVINSAAEFDERTPLDVRGRQHRSSWRVILNGTRTLVDALADSIVENNGIINTNTAIQKILIEDNRVVGLMDNKGDKYNCDTIVASGGASRLFKELVGYENLPQEFIDKYLKNPSLTESVFMLNVGVNYDITEHQESPICYYYNTYDIDGSIKECKNGLYHKGDDGLLVYILSAHSPEMAPPGHHSVQIYTIAPNNPVNGDWNRNKEAWAEYLLDLAEKHLPGLKKHITTKIVLTPKDFQKRLHLDFHSFGGVTPNIRVTPPPHRTPIKGLWFIGAQSSSLGGVTGAMTGAYEAVENIEKEYGK